MLEVAQRPFHHGRARAGAGRRRRRPDRRAAARRQFRVARLDGRGDECLTDPDARQNALVRMIDAQYFSTMRIALKAGRGFTTDDHPASERVAVINEGLARALWPDADPLGRVIRTSGRDYRVVGVVNDVRYFALERDTGHEIYMLHGQTGDYQTVDLVVRSAVAPAHLIPAIREALKRADPGLPAVEFLNDGTARRSVAVHTAHHRSAARGIRRLRPGPRGVGTLRGDLVLGQSAHTGDRRPHGPRCLAIGHAEAGPVADDDPGNDRPGHRPSVGLDRGASDPGAAVRRRRRTC